MISYHGLDGFPPGGMFSYRVVGNQTTLVGFLTGRLDFIPDPLVGLDVAVPSLLREAPTLARTWQRTSLRARLTRSNIGHERNTFLNLGEIDFRKIIWKFKKLATCLNMSGHYNFLLVQHIFLEIKTEEVVCTPIVMYQLRS